MSDFADFWLETARIQSNSLKMFKTEDTMRPCFNPIEQYESYMAAFERDRDSAASVSEPCTRCGIVAELDECPFCHRLYCEPCQEKHECTIQQLRDGVMNWEILRRLG